MEQVGEGRQAGVLSSLGHIPVVRQGQGTYEPSQALSSWELTRLEPMRRHGRSVRGLGNQELGTSSPEARAEEPSD